MTQLWFFFPRSEYMRRECHSREDQGDVEGPSITFHPNRPILKRAEQRVRNTAAQCNTNTWGSTMEHKYKGEALRTVIVDA